MRAAFPSSLIHIILDCWADEEPNHAMEDGAQVLKRCLKFGASFCEDLSTKQSAVNLSCK